MKKGTVTQDLDPEQHYGTQYVGDFIAENINDDEEQLILNRENIWLGKSTII